jgi:hypothetical protein
MGQYRSPLQTVTAPAGALTPGLGAERRLRAGNVVLEERLHVVQMP